MLNAQCLSFKFKNCNEHFELSLLSMFVWLNSFYFFSVDSHTWAGYALHPVLILQCSEIKNRNRITKTKWWTKCNSAIQSPRESQFQHLTSSEIIKIGLNQNAQNEKEIKRQKWQKDRKRIYECHKIVRIKTKHINNAWWKATYRAGELECCLLLLLLSWIHHHSFLYLWSSSSYHHI